MVLGSVIILQLSCSLPSAAEVTGKMGLAAAARAMRMVGLAKKQDDEDEEDEEEEEELALYRILRSYK